MRLYSLISVVFLLTQQVCAQFSTVNMYTFGHSLIDHRPPAIPTPSDETTILHWMSDIAQHAGNTFSATGQYGFLTTHVNLPPSSNWGYDSVLTSWDDSMQPFANTNMNTTLLTAANFIQYVQPTDPHPLDNSTTVVEATETIFDWVNTQQPNMRFYIYANWPEMNLQSAYPPTLPLQSEIDNFHSQTLGQFADWWIDYQDAMLASRPQLNTRLIPVGMILSELLSDSLGNQIPFDELYEDSAPHGRATLYFLAGMITYMAVYEQPIPSGYMPDSIVHAEVRNNMATISNAIWNALGNFNLPTGNSRVFFSPALQVSNTQKQAIELFPNPCNDRFQVSFPTSGMYSIQIVDATGRIHWNQSRVNGTSSVDISSLPPGMCFVQLQETFGNQTQTVKLIVSALD